MMDNRTNNVHGTTSPVDEDKETKAPQATPASSTPETAKIRDDVHKLNSELQKVSTDLNALSVQTNKALATNPKLELPSDFAKNNQVLADQTNEAVATFTQTVRTLASMQDEEKLKFFQEQRNILVELQKKVGAQQLILQSAVNLARINQTNPPKRQPKKAVEAPKQKTSSSNTTESAPTTNIIRELGVRINQLKEKAQSQKDHAAFYKVIVGRLDEAMTLLRTKDAGKIRVAEKIFNAAKKATDDAIAGKGCYLGELDRIDTKPQQTTRKILGKLNKPFQETSPPPLPGDELTEKQKREAKRKIKADEREKRNAARKVARKEKQEKSAERLAEKKEERAQTRTNNKDRLEDLLASLRLLRALTNMEKTNSEEGKEEGPHITLSRYIYLQADALYELLTKEKENIYNNLRKLESAEKMYKALHDAAKNPTENDLLDDQKLALASKLSPLKAAWNNAGEPRWSEPGRKLDTVTPPKDPESKKDTKTEIPLTTPTAKDKTASTVGASLTTPSDIPTEKDEAKPNPSATDTESPSDEEKDKASEKDTKPKKSKRTVATSETESDSEDEDVDIEEESNLATDTENDEEEIRDKRFRDDSSSGSEAETELESRYTDAQKSSLFKEFDNRFQEKLELTKWYFHRFVELKASENHAGLKALKKNTYKMLEHMELYRDGIKAKLEEGNLDKYKKQMYEKRLNELNTFCHDYADEIDRANNIGADQTGYMGDEHEPLILREFNEKYHQNMTLEQAIVALVTDKIDKQQKGQPDSGLEGTLSIEDSEVGGIKLAKKLEANEALIIKRKFEVGKIIKTPMTYYAAEYKDNNNNPVSKIFLNPKFIPKLGKDEYYFRMALEEVKSLKMRRTNYREPMTLTGSFPPEFVKAMATYCAVMNEREPGKGYKLISGYKPTANDMAKMREKLDAPINALDGAERYTSRSPGDSRVKEAEKHISQALNPPPDEPAPPAPPGDGGHAPVPASSGDSAVEAEEAHSDGEVELRRGRAALGRRGYSSE